MSSEPHWLNNGLPAFHGGKDRGMARCAIDRLAGPDGFKTGYQTQPDGTLIITQTKGTMPPEITVQKPPVATSMPPVLRTFVFNYENATSGIVANKGSGSGGMTVLTTSKVVARACYGVSGLRTKTGGRSVLWNDVWRLDRTPYTGAVLFTINGATVTPLNVKTVEDRGASMLPFVASTNGAYVSPLNTTPPILPLFIGYSQAGIGHGVAALNPDGTVKETILAAVDSSLGGAAGLTVDANGTFGFLGSTLLQNGDDPDTLDGCSVSWASIQATATAPYLARIDGASAGFELGWFPPQQITPSISASEYDPGGYVLLPVYGRMQVALFPWNFNGIQTSDPIDNGYIDYTYAWEDPGSLVTPSSISPLLLLTTEAGSISKHHAWTVDNGTGGLFIDYTMSGDFLYNWCSGQIWQASQYDVDSPHTYMNPLYDGEERGGSSSARTSVILRTECVVPKQQLLVVDVVLDRLSEHEDTLKTTDFGLAEWGLRSLDGGQYGYYYDKGKGFPEKPKTFIPQKRMRFGGKWIHYTGGTVEPSVIEQADIIGARNRDIANAHGGEVFSVQTTPLKTRTSTSLDSETMAMTASTCDYLYVDDVEGVYIYLESQLTYSVSKSGQDRSPAWSLTANFVVDSRFGGTNVQVDVGNVEEPHVQVITPFSNDYTGPGQFLTKYHANFVPPPLFTPVFRNQGNCPHIAYTTRAEEANGATPEFYLDMQVRPCLYSTMLGRSIYSGVVEFVPHQFVHVYQRYIKNVDPAAADDRNLHLFEAMFPLPTRLQITNGQAAGVQVGLDLSVVTPELSRT